nr:unnamed protein product [Callosobruchus analis]
MTHNWRLANISALYIRVSLSGLESYCFYCQH